MSEINIDNAKEEVNSLFNDLAPMVEEIAAGYSKELDSIIKNLTNAAALTNDEIREYMLKLSIEAYMFGISKDASTLRQECSTTLMKEAQANSYNKTDGTQQIRTNQSILDTLDKQVVTMVYSAVNNLMKTKQDEAHRIVNSLNSILISRNAEAKIQSNIFDDEQPTKRILNE